MSTYTPVEQSNVAANKTTADFRLRQFAGYRCGRVIDAEGFNNTKVLYVASDCIAELARTSVVITKTPPGEGQPELIVL